MLSDLLLLIYCIVYFLLFLGVLCLSLICYALLYVHSSFAIILKRNESWVLRFYLSYRCLVTVNVLWLFLTVPWVVGLQCVIVVFPDHTHLLFHSLKCCQPVYTYFAFCLSLFVSIADDVNICRNTITIIIKLT